MKIEITDDTGTYNWILYDGLEEIDEFYGSEYTLREAFEAIIARRAMIGLEYAEDIETGTTALKDHCSSGEQTISLDQVIEATESVNADSLVDKLKETTSTIVFAIK